MYFQSTLGERGKRCHMLPFLEFRFGLLDFGTCWPLNFWTFGLWEFRTLGLWDFGDFGDFGPVETLVTLALWDFGTLGLWDTWTFGLWNFRPRNQAREAWGTRPDPRITHPRGTEAPHSLGQATHCSGLQEEAF